MFSFKPELCVFRKTKPEHYDLKQVKNFAKESGFNVTLGKKQLCGKLINKYKENVAGPETRNVAGPANVRKNPKQLKKNIEKLKSNWEKENKLKLKQQKKPTSVVMSRLTTLINESVKMFLKTKLEPHQPKYEKIDEIRKRKIFEYEDGYSAFSHNKQEALDHMYGIKEGFQQDFKHFGSDSKWNLIPATQLEHTSKNPWKNVKVKVKDGFVYKNFVYNKLTTKEFQTLSEKDKLKVRNFWRWEIYVKERGAVMYWDNSERINEMIKNIIYPHLLNMHNEINMMQINKKYANNDQFIKKNNTKKIRRNSLPI